MKVKIYNDVNEYVKTLEANHIITCVKENGVVLHGFNLGVEIFKEYLPIGYSGSITIL